MKRFIVSFLCLAALQAFANPIIAPPKAVISELYFDAGGKWFLEVEFWGPVDTIRINTNSGEAYFLAGKASRNNHFVVLTSDSLNNQLLAINKKNDFVQVVTKPDPNNKQYVEIDSIRIGIQPGSAIDSIPTGCSINKNWFSKAVWLDNSPTLGLPNDVIGTTGTIYGHFYQLGAYLEASNTKYFYFPELFTMSTDLWSVGYPIDLNGDFSTKVRTGKYSINHLLFFTQSTVDVFQKAIETKLFSVYPGDSIRIDFMTVASLKKPVRKTELFAIYPNPANDKTSFVFDMPLNKTNELYIKLYSLDGKFVQVIQPISGVFDFDCSSLKTGTYVCKMEQAGITVASTKLLIVR